MAKAKHPLLRPTKWRQYNDMDHAETDHQLRLRRLRELGKIDPDDLLFECRKGHCGFGSKIPPHRTSSPNPFPCSAMCRVAHIRLERKEVPFISHLLTAFDPQPLFVTVASPSYWLRPEHLPKFNVSGIVQSIKRGLKKAEEATGQTIVAVGRVDFDLGKAQDGRVMVRPHVHLVVTGSDERTLKSHLRQRYDSEAFPTLKPVVVKQIKDRGALHYTLKCRLGGLPNQCDAPLDFAHNRQRLGVGYEALFDESASRETIPRIPAPV
ncbi:hypothetical protein [Mesorhizobium sp. M0843]|uniref:hypothetical protein n=1 Tax=Mesorhizobium sp. M0843 TaxID=2957010 RepID=UPI00333859B6